MIIVELFLKSFGKFKNKKIKLSNGLNLIYGLNESGKSTVHKFIEGMFYGFFNPITKTKRYTDDYFKYYPWESNEYRGILKYSYKNQNYIIDRNFIKGNDIVKVFDEKDGQDISNIFEYDKVKRMINPGLTHLKINSIIFNNTINIGQLNVKTDNLLVKEIKDSLINLGGSLDEDISVKKALDKLKTKVDNIGTINREKSSQYGRVYKEIKELKIEKARAKDIFKDIKEAQFTLNNLYDKIKKLRVRKSEIEEKIVLRSIGDKINRYEEALKLTKEIEIIKNEIKMLEKYKETDSNDYFKILDIERKIELLKENVNNSQIKINNAKNSLSQIEIKEDKNLIKLANSLKGRIEKKNKLISKITFISIILLIVSITLGIVGVYKNLFFYFLPTTIIPFIIFIFKLKSNSSEIMKLQNDLLEVKHKIYAQQREIIEKEKYYNDIILTERNEIDKIKDIIDFKREEIQTVLFRNNCISIEDLNHAILCKENYDNLIKDLKYKEDILSKVLKNETLESLREKIEEYKKKNNDYYFEFDVDDLSKELNDVNGLILEKEKEISSLEQKISILSNETRPIQEIEEDLESKIEIISKFELELDSLKLAIDTINEISYNIQKDFAPKLNNKVSEFISKVTNNRYKDIKIDKNLEIKVLNSESNELIDISSLSLGTIDQMYFGTRLGIIDIIRNDDKLPLILDDTFTQYDDERLENILKLLSNLASDRQIILFTCQNREKIILDNNKIKYNYIEL